MCWAAIQTNNLGHRLTHLAYFREDKQAWDGTTPCDRMGWAGR